MKQKKKGKRKKRSLHERIFAVDSNHTRQGLTRGKLLFIISSASRRFPPPQAKISNSGGLMPHSGKLLVGDIFLVTFLRDSSPV